MAAILFRDPESGVDHFGMPAGPCPWGARRQVFHRVLVRRPQNNQTWPQRAAALFLVRGRDVCFVVGNPDLFLRGAV